MVPVPSALTRMTVSLWKQPVERAAATRHEGDGEPAHRGSIAFRRRHLARPDRLGVPGHPAMRPFDPGICPPAVEILRRG